MARPAVQIAETVIGEDDENVEAWYLLAFSLFRLKKYATAEECCKSVRNLIIKFKILDPELEQGTLEIYEKCQAIKAKEQQTQSAEMNPEEGGEWETDSEEDIDGGDDDEEMKE